ncbi:MAG: DUF4962 domain-containing protein [Clostridia bacterium]
MKKLLEQESGTFTVQYLPNNTEIIENPPRFSWLPSNDDNGPYDLEIATDADFENIAYKYTDVMYNFFAPDHVLKAGKYFWRYTLSGGEYEFSQVREFELAEGLPETPVASAKDRFANADLSHPRLWLSGEKLVEFKKAVKADPTHCNFDQLIKMNVEKYFGTPFIEEPAKYPPELKVLRPLPPEYRPLWRKSYHDCQKTYNRMRAIAVAGVVTENEEWIAEGIKYLLYIASWDCLGSTKRSYHDESSFRVLSALCWGYDWLYNHLTVEQRETVKKSLITRTQEITDFVFHETKIQYALFDSHAVRSVSFVLIPCGIVLYGEHDEAEDWVNCAVDYVNVLYTPWGGKDGGWAEGGLYWTTGLAFLIDALNLLKNFTGVNIFKRPFFLNTGNYPLYCWPHDGYRVSFGDQSNLGEKPILKTGFNIRALAGATGNGTHRWYCDQIAKRSNYVGNDMYDTGWWEFYFDEVMFMSNQGSVVSEAPKGGRNVKYFSDIGWVAMHRDMDNEDEHVFLLTKSSKYGSVSHSHGDQNAILMFAFGDPLLVETGYYVSFGSDMHVKWRRQTRSKNTLLIDGRGQYAEMDQIKQLAATGEVEVFEETEKYVYVKENATKAYGENVPELQDYTREIYFVDDTYFVIVDSVEIAEELDVSFMLHSIYKPEYADNKYAIRGEKANLDVEMLYISSGIEDLHLTNEFPAEVNPKDYEGLDKQWHYTMTSGKAKKHTLVSYYYPSKTGSTYNFTATSQEVDGKKVFKFINEGKEFVLEV